MRLLIIYIIMWISVAAAISVAIYTMHSGVYLWFFIIPALITPTSIEVR